MARLLSRHGDARVLWRANPGSCRAYILMAGLHLAEGVALLFGAGGRTSGPAYRTINELGGPRTCGAALALVGLLLAAAPLRSLPAVRLMLLIGSACQMLLALSFAASAINESKAGLLGPIVYGIFSLWLISNAELYRTGRR